MQTNTTYAFITYFGLAFGAAASIFGNILIYIMANYAHLTFKVCCLGRVPKSTSLDYVQRISFSATFCSFCSTSLQVRCLFCAQSASGLPSASASASAPSQPCQIVALWPQITVSCPASAALYGTMISEVNDASGIGKIAFAFGMLIVHFTLPLFILLSVIETKVHSHPHIPP